MHNTIVVKVLQGQDCFSKVHPAHFYRQWAHVLKQVGTVTTLIKMNKTQATMRIIFQVYERLKLKNEHHKRRH